MTPPTFPPTCASCLAMIAELRTALAGPWRDGHGPSAAQQVLIERALAKLLAAGIALRTAAELQKQPQGESR